MGFFFIVKNNKKSYVSKLFILTLPKLVELQKIVVSKMESTTLGKCFQLNYFRNAVFLAKKKHNLDEAFGVLR